MPVDLRELIKEFREVKHRGMIWLRGTYFHIDWIELVPKDGKKFTGMYVFYRSEQIGYVDGKDIETFSRAPGQTHLDIYLAFQDYLQ